MFDNFKLSIDPDASTAQVEAKVYVFNNFKKTRISRSLPSFFINIDDEKPKKEVKKFPEIKPGEPMTEEDVSPDP